MGYVKFLPLRVLRNTPGALWKQLKARVTVALTANGVPKALVIGLEPGDLEDTLHAIRRARAQIAVSRMRERASETGLAKTTPEVIEAEIGASRKARRR